MVIALNNYYINKNIKKRLLCLLLSLLLIVTITFLQKQEAEAFFPIVIAGVAIAPEVVAGCATILCAAGLLFASSTDAQNAACQMYASASSSIQNKLYTLKTGIASVSTDVWNYTTEWVNTKFQQGSNTLTNTLHDYTENNNTWPFSLSQYEIYPIGDSFQYGSNAYTLTRIAFDSTRDKIIIAKNGSEYISVKCDTGTYATMYVYGSSIYGLILEIYFQNYLTHAFESNTIAYLSNSMSYVQEALSNPNTSYSARGQDIVDTDYDFESDGTREVIVPNTVDGIVGKTYTDVQNIDPVLPITYPGTWTGTFRDCVPTGSYTFTGTGTITGAVGYSTTGTWEGEWSRTAEGKKVWTGTLTDAQSLTWTGVVEETASSTGESEFDYPEMKIPADILKSKFPFSIPWDLTNAVKSLVATPKAPKWTIEFPSNVFVGGGEIIIDFSQFEAWAKIIRWGVLIAFNIFLILATRKIIGAS